MKFMIVISALAACASAQVPYPGFATGPFATAYAATGYAPSFGYSAYGTPASTAPLGVRTALDVFQRPALAAYAAPAPAVAAAPAYAGYAGYTAGFPYYAGYNAFAGYPAAVAPAAAAVPAIAAAPAPATVAVEPAVAPAVAVKTAEEGEVVVVEAQEEPLKAEGPVVLRAIIPVFPDDLRSGDEDIVFARPDQVVPVNPAVIKEDADELPAVVAPAFQRSAVFAPAGIVQATQPRFFAHPSAFRNPVFAF